MPLVIKVNKIDAAVHQLDWLKHYDHSHPMEIEIEPDSEAAQYILRSVANLVAV